jgi:FAD/FMN-containing dehydrogenase
VSRALIRFFMADTSWQNWSGSIRFTSGQIVRPASEEELLQVVANAAGENKTVRVAGAGHSSMPLVETSDIVVSLERMKGVVAHDAARCRATILPAMTVDEASKALLQLGLAMHNTGDVDVQCVSGAIGTGTHGSGINLGNLSWMLAGMRMVTANGVVREYSSEGDPEMLDAARVALGSLGIFSALTLQLQPAYKLLRHEWCADLETTLDHFAELVHANRHFDMYWYPRSDEVKLRTANEPGRGMTEIAWARQLKEELGWVGEILPRHRTLKFEEMEYAVPADSGLECFTEVRRRVLDRHRQYVGWRVLYRTVAADGGWLSPFHGRASATIAILQNIGLEYWAYFKDIEPIFRAYGGRPHWGKKHTLLAADLRRLYPCWDNFLQLRAQMDPAGTFLNPYLRELFGL